MPTVPRVTETSVREAPIPGVQYSAPAGANAETFGAPPKETNTNFQAGLKIAAKAYAYQKKQAADVKAQEVDNQAGLAETDIQNEVTKMQGADAFGAQDYLDKSWGKVTEDSLADVKDEYTKGLITKKLNARYQSLYKTTQAHTTNQSIKYDKDVTDGGVKVAQDLAVSAFNNPEEVDKQLYIIGQTRFKWGMRNGQSSLTEDGKQTMSPELKDSINNDVSRTVEQVYKRRMLTGDFDGAEDIREQFSKHITAEDNLSMDETKNKLVVKQAEQQEKAITAKIEANGISLAEATLNGDFEDLATLEKVRLMGEARNPNGINSTSYSTIKRYIESEPIQTEIYERNMLMAGMADYYFNIDKDEDNEVDKNVRYVQIAQFQKAAFDAHYASAITDDQLKSKLENLKQAFNGGITGLATEKHKNGQTTWRFTKKWLQDNMSGIQIVDDGASYRLPLDQQQVDKALAYVGNNLMAYMLDNDIKAEQVQPLTELLLGQYIVKEHPEFAGQTGLPNAIANASVSFRKLYPGKSEYKPDADIQNKQRKIPAYDPATQKLKINQRTGEIVAVPK